MLVAFLRSFFLINAKGETIYDQTKCMCFHKTFYLTNCFHLIKNSIHNLFWQRCLMIVVVATCTRFEEPVSGQMSYCLVTGF